MTRAAYTDLMARVSAVLQYEAEAYSLLRQLRHASPGAVADAMPQIHAWIDAYEERRGLKPKVSVSNNTITIPFPDDTL